MISFGQPGKNRDIIVVISKFLRRKGKKTPSFAGSKELTKLHQDVKSIISQLNQLELSFRRRKNNSCFCTDDMRDNLTGMIYPSTRCVPN